MDTRLWINTDGDFHEVDLYDDIDIPVTYNVADVQDISKKDSNWSLTVKIPNTQNNAQLFDLVDNIGIYGSTFELLKQYPAFVEVGCNRTFEGYFKLTKVIINDDREVSYEGSLYSNVMEFVNRLGTTTLRGNDDPADDLDFSGWTTLIDENEMQDRVTNMRPYFSFILTNKGNYNGVNTPIKSDCALQNVGGNDVVPYYYDELTPYLYVRDIVDSIGKWSGFNIISDFFDGSPSFLSEYDVIGFDFTKLIYPYLGENSQYCAGTNTDVCHIVQNTTTPIAPITITGTNYSPMPTYALTDDDVVIASYPDYSETNSGSATHTGTSHRYHITKGGFFRISTNLKAQLGVDFLYNPGINPPMVPAGDTINVLNTDPQVSLILKLGVYHAASGVYSYVDASVTENLHNAYYTHTVDSTHLSTVTMLEAELVASEDMFLEAGDEVFLSLGISVPAVTTNPNQFIYRYTTGGQNYDVLPKYMNLWFVPQNPGNEVLRLEKISTISPGNNFDPTFILSRTEKKIDFMTNLIRKFNLYVEDVTDKRDENGVYYRDYAGIRQNEPILKMEPRNYYYSSNPIVRDWTQRTDVSTIEFQRIDDYLYKRLNFKDTYDKEYFVSLYNDASYVEGEFGEKKIIGPYNTSAEEKLDITTTLGETMVMAIPFEGSTIEVPSFLAFDQNGAIVRDKQFNPRFLFCKSINLGDYGFTHIQWLGLYKRHFRLNPYPYETPYDFAVETPDVMLASYNWSSHLNGPFSTDNADLNWGWANWYMVNLMGSWADRRNTYHSFYENMIDEYNSPEARLMKCKMYLKSSEIRDLQLSDTIIVNSVAYHINKIKQWKNEYSPVEVELIKIIESNSVQVQPILKGIKNSPKISLPVPTAVIRDEVEGLTKLVDENKDELSKNRQTINSINEMIKKLDERLQKLEKM